MKKQSSTEKAELIRSQQPNSMLSARLEQAVNESTPFRLLLVGKTGAGKSSLVNSLFGTSVAPVGDFEPATFAVETYPFRMNDIRFKVIDTPGLCDQVADAGNDKRYLEMIHSKIDSFDSLLLVFRLDERRVTADDKQAIRLLSEAFGNSIWDQSVIVFTHAGQVPVQNCVATVRKRGELVRQAIRDHAGYALAGAIPSSALTITTKPGSRTARRWESCSTTV